MNRLDFNFTRDPVCLIVVQLILNGHPLWSLWVLCPVIVNTFFMLFACARLEKRYWYLYTPLVLFQIYPQFCVARIILKLAGKNINDNDFRKERDDLDGSVGFLGALQSIPQSFIQTAFFTISNSLHTTLTRLCYNEKVPSCKEYDICPTEIRNVSTCSNFTYQTSNCNKVEYQPYHYNSYEEMDKCKDRIYDCTRRFEDCLKKENGLEDCLNQCKTNLTKIIKGMDLEVFMERFLGKGARDIDLSVDYGASQEDLKIIQLDLLYDDHCYAFLFTFAISVIAAVYGVTKFFRFSYSRHCDKLVKSNLTITGEREEYKNQGLNIISFLMTFTMSGMYLCGKALALAAFMWVNENTMGQNVAWWVFFCMIPSFIFALVVIFGRTCYKTDHQCLKGYPVYNNWSFRIFFKAPAVIGIPTVTPFTYKTKTVGVTRIEDLDDDDKRYMHHESMVAYFVLGYRLSYINNLLTIFFTSIGLMTIAHLETVLVGTISTIFFRLGSSGVLGVAGMNC